MTIKRTTPTPVSSPASLRSLKTTNPLAHTNTRRDGERRVGDGE
jgi:hypothetical protein